MLVRVLAGVCWGFFTLMQSEVGLLDSETRVPLFHVCAPYASLTSQFIAIFENYADDHPEELNKDAMLVAMESLQKAWPYSHPPKKRH